MVYLRLMAGDKKELRGKLISRFQYSGPVTSVAFSQDGKYLAACAQSLTIRRLGTPEMKKDAFGSIGDLCHLYRCDSQLSACAFSPASGGRIIASVDDAKRLTLREFETDEHDYVSGIILLRFV